MREADPDRTSELFERVAALLQLAHTALSQATAVLSRPAVKGGKRMAAVNRTLGDLWDEAEDLASNGLTTGADREADIRTVITDMYVGEDVGRMGVLARQVGDIAWARQTKPPLPAPVRDAVQRIADDCLALIGRAHDAVVSPAAEPVTEAHLADIADQQLRLCRMVLSDSGSLDVVNAVDTSVLSRCYVECAQRAAAVSLHMALLRETAPPPEPRHREG
ncbi:hypothetical protein [Streptomyces sp. UNOB3_S3]|uniref:hypothetical protein n=1 Tax=Streptomyces sp. UNOB3_S3 TaxID=2871682 RepID=UPI001E549DB6|nr:hypothetical protein [Streptomyces sp. UNOB3_S3]MCC3773270.1 hypothetical protein [Streptomyces sp. UNOB3_S3]